MNKNEMKYFSVAREVSKLSDNTRYHIGAIVVKHKNIVGMGRNSRKTHPLQYKLNKWRPKEPSSVYNGQLHAEIQAIVNTRGIDLNKAEIYVYRETLNDTLACCRPCSACMKLIKQRGIKKIHYTTEDGFVTEELV